MVIRAEVLAERLAALREAVARLRDVRARDLSDPALQWAAERGLQVAAQALFDVGNHVLAGAFALRASDYAQIPPLLAERGVIDREIEQRLRGLAGFRNLLVHDYAHVDAARVRTLLDTRLDDFDAFAASVERWATVPPTT